MGYHDLIPVAIGTVFLSKNLFVIILIQKVTMANSYQAREQFS